MNSPMATPGATTIHHLPYELLLTILECAIQPGSSTNTASDTPAASTSCDPATQQLTACARSVCRTWRTACDTLIKALHIRTWPCPFQLHQRFPSLIHVQLLNLTPAAGSDAATAATAPSTRHTRSRGPPPPTPHAAAANAHITHAQSLLYALSQLPHLKQLSISQAWRGAVCGRESQNLVAAVVAGLPRLSQLQQVVLEGDGIVQPTQSMVAAMAAPTADSGLHHLTQLSIHSTRLRHLPFRSTTMSAVRVLHAPGLPHMATTLASTQPQHWQQLHSLNLRQCNLAALPDALLSQLAQLQHLDVASNNLTALPQSLGDLISLKHFDASDNKLASLPSSFSALTSLTYLNLSSNWQLGGSSLLDLPTTLPCLEFCDLSATGMTSLPLRPDWPRLQTLLLSCNELTEVPLAVMGCKALQTLCFDHNELSALPDWLPTSCPALTALDVSNNKIQQLPTTFTALAASLQTLHLASNSFTTLPPTLYRLTALTDLDLQDNALGPVLPSVLWSCKQLEVLNVAGNKVKQLPPDMAQLTKLRWLDMSMNELTSLPWADDAMGYVVDANGAGPSSSGSSSGSRHSTHSSHQPVTFHAHLTLPVLEVLKLRGNMLPGEEVQWVRVVRCHTPRLSVCDLECDQECEVEGPTAQQPPATVTLQPPHGLSASAC